MRVGCEFYSFEFLSLLNSFQTDKYPWFEKSPMLDILEENKSNVVKNKKTHCAPQLDQRH